MRALVASLLLVSCVAAQSTGARRSGMGIVFPTSLGEGQGDAKAAGGPAAAASSEQGRPPKAGELPATATTAKASEAGKPVGGPPDPEPLRLAEQWEYEFEWDAGELRVRSVRPLKYAKPRETERRIGRFAVELWIGSELVERVRFDFPLLAGDDLPSAGTQAPVLLAPGAHVTQRVLVPAAPRARRARLVDRATSKIVELTWPPTAENGAASLGSRSL